MWCFQSVFQLPVLSFQLLFWHLTNSSHSQSVRAVFVCLSLSFPVALSAGLEQTLFLLVVKLLCWLGTATATSASGLLKGKGALPFPVELLLLADWVAKPELTQWRRNHTMAHAVPLLQFPGSLAAKGSKCQGSHTLPQGDSPRAQCLHPGPPSLQRLVSTVSALACNVASEMVSGCPSRQNSTAGFLQAHMATSPPLAGLEEDGALPGGPLCRLT